MNDSAIIIEYFDIEMIGSKDISFESLKDLESKIHKAYNEFIDKHKGQVKPTYLSMNYITNKAFNYYMQHTYHMFSCSFVLKQFVDMKCIIDDNLKDLKFNLMYEVE